MLPTIGRIVLYNHPGSADGLYKPSQSPAIVQAVNRDGTLKLWVFGPLGFQIMPSIPAGGPDVDTPSPSTWIWPPRV